MSTTLQPNQLCSFYLDGNSEAAFTVFEHGGPSELRRFLGIAAGASVDADDIWQVVYRELLVDHGFFRQLFTAYPSYMFDLVTREGIPLVRKIFAIDDVFFDGVLESAIAHFDVGAQYMRTYVRTHDRHIWARIMRDGSDTVRHELGLAESEHEALWLETLDYLLDAYMRDAWHERRRAHVKEIFRTFRSALKDEI